MKKEGRKKLLRRKKERLKERKTERKNTYIYIYIYIYIYMYVCMYVWFFIEYIYIYIYTQWCLLFNGISTLFRSFNAKAILLEEQKRYYLTHSWEDKGVHTFPRGICPKVNVIARLEYELAYYDSAVHLFNHYTTRTPPILNERPDIYTHICMHVWVSVCVSGLSLSTTGTMQPSATCCMIA